MNVVVQVQVSLFVLIEISFVLMAKLKNAVRLMA